jgi:hypothetical protein
VAFKKTSLTTLMQALHVGTYLIGDAAFSISERMLLSYETTSVSREFGSRLLLG